MSMCSHWKKKQSRILSDQWGSVNVGHICLIDLDCLIYECNENWTQLIFTDLLFHPSHCAKRFPHALFLWERTYSGFIDERMSSE